MINNGDNKNWSALVYDSNENIVFSYNASHDEGFITVDTDITSASTYNVSVRTEVPFQESPWVILTVQTSK